MIKRRMIKLIFLLILVGSVGCIILLALSRQENCVLCTINTQCISEQYVYFYCLNDMNKFYVCIENDTFCKESDYILESKNISIKKHVCDANSLIVYKDFHNEECIIKYSLISKKSTSNKIYICDICKSRYGIQDESDLSFVINIPWEKELIPISEINSENNDCYIIIKNK